MPPLQTTYSEYIGVAYAGMIANTEPNNLISREAQAAPIPFGAACAQGTGDRQVVAVTATGQVFRGIACRDKSIELPSSGGVAEVVPVGQAVLLMVRGVIWVLAGATVAAGQPAYVVIGTGQAGRFTSSAAGNLAIPNAMFDSAGAVGELVKLRLL